MENETEFFLKYLGISVAFHCLLSYTVSTNEMVLCILSESDIPIHVEDFVK